MFARMLHRAQQCGVLVMAHDVCWQGGQATWGRQLPVVYDPSKEPSASHNTQGILYDATVVGLQTQILAVLLGPGC